MLGCGHRLSIAAFTMSGLVAFEHGVVLSHEVGDLVRVRAPVGPGVRDEQRARRFTAPALHLPGQSHRLDVPHLRCEVLLAANGSALLGAGWCDRALGRTGQQPPPPPHPPPQPR
jgi:hypothetical protein